MTKILMDILEPKGSIVSGRSGVKDFDKWMLIDRVDFTLKEYEPETEWNNDSGGTDPVKQFVRIVKKVDRSSVYLMKVAAQDRSASELPNRWAHVSLFQTRSNDPGETEKGLFPFLQMKFGGVRIVNWNIKAIADESESTETFDLHFQQLAMVYFSTEVNQGSGLITYGPKSWDETKRDVWADGEKSDWYKTPS